ncbi:MAG: hypothetical protein ACLPV8_17695 [Steroidobacteraceae bacterium]
MATYTRALGSISAALIIAACAASGGNVKAPAAQSAADPPCTPQTGSRIAANETDQSLVVRCYTDTDISRTGVPTAAQAVQQLDPAIRVGH